MPFVGVIYTKPSIDKIYISESGINSRDEWKNKFLKIINPWIFASPVHCNSNNDIYVLRIDNTNENFDCETVLRVTETIHSKILHRVDGPACEYDDGTKEYFCDGNYHRIGGPACEYPNGVKIFYNNGVLHNDNGYAYEAPGGRRALIKHGRLDNGEGPLCAIVGSDQLIIVGDSKVFTIGENVL